MRHLAILLALALGGCSADPKAAEFTGSLIHEHYTVFIHRDADADLIQAEWLNAVEKGVQYLLRYDGVDEGTLRLRAETFRYYVFAGPFEVRGSPTGWAAGVAYLDYHTIGISWEVDGQTHCPALGHELGHFWFGPDFEHGWAPPLRQSTAD